MGEVGKRGAPPTWQRTAVVLVTLAFAPLASRGVLLFERVSSASFLDLRGVLSDLAVSLAATTVLVPLSRAGRLPCLLACALAFVWALLHYANFETVRVLGALASMRDLAYLGDSTFVLGSAVAISRPILLSTLLLVSVGSFWWSRSASIPAALLCIPLTALAVMGHRSSIFNEDAARWRQIHFVQENLTQLAMPALDPSQTASAFRDSQSAVLDLMPEMAADLRGKPIVSMPNPGLNVLLVILESLSGLYVHSLATEQGRSQQANMPQLDAIARSNLRYSTFFTHQRRTNRGVYSLLCGDLPNLLPGLPKMSAYVEGGRSCLPEILRRQGYETVYLQSAPLAFMQKDRFMPLVGFNEVYGHKWFKQHYAQSRWGVDDRAMLEQSIGLIRELQQRDRPWFLTLLTVGTHHPYLYPQTFQEGRGTAVQRSFAYLDLAVGEFNRRLNQLGVNRDTLIIYTSDESSALATSKVAQNWGHLIARVPKAAQLLVTEPFAQMDVALSVLDFLGLGRSGSHLFGRSVFRRYEDERFIFFSNTNHSYVGARDPAGRLQLCSDDYKGCNRYEFEDGKFFGRKHRRIGSEMGDFELLRKMGPRSVTTSRKDASERRFEMMSDPIFLVDASIEDETQLIHGGVYLDVKKGEWVEVEFEVDARGPKAARTNLIHLLRSLKVKHIRSWIEPLEDGQTLRLRYTYAPEDATNGVQFHTTVQILGSEDLELNFISARVTHRRSGDRPETGVKVHLSETSPTSKTNADSRDES